MALVTCSECGKEVSDAAVSCPGCGAPTGIAGLSGAQERKKRKTSPIAWAALIAIVTGIAWYSQTREFKEQSLPPLPVEVRYRTAMLGPGMVFHVKNTSSKPLFAVVTLKNPTTREEKSFRIDLARDGTAEIGHQEGWVLAPGDTFQVFNEAFQTFQGSIP
jgi:hypothetical protein